MTGQDRCLSYSPESHSRCDLPAGHPHDAGHESWLNDTVRAVWPTDRRSRSHRNGTATVSSDETIAKLFHDTYERLAPNYGYETRDETAVSWEDVPEPNRSLMLAVAGVVRASVVAELVSAAGRPTARSTPAFVRGWDAALTAISRTAGGNTR